MKLENKTLSKWETLKFFSPSQYKQILYPNSILHNAVLKLIIEIIGNLPLSHFQVLNNDIELEPQSSLVDVPTLNVM